MVRGQNLLNKSDENSDWQSPFHQFNSITCMCTECKEMCLKITDFVRLFQPYYSVYSESMLTWIISHIRFPFFCWEFQLSTVLVCYSHGILIIKIFYHPGALKYAERGADGVHFQWILLALLVKMTCLSENTFMTQQIVSG